MSEFKLILFGLAEFRKPVQCYQVGLLGCMGNTDIKNDDDSFSYFVQFEGDLVLKIDDTFYVSD